MALLNHTTQELKKISDHTIKSFRNDIVPLFENSQQVCNQDNMFHFGIIRQAMAYIEFCGAIYCGWKEKNKKHRFDTGKICTSDKAIRFIEEVMGKIDSNYKKNGRLFYCMYRHGSTHLLRPHQIQRMRSKFLFTWRWYSGERKDKHLQLKHLKLIKISSTEFELPVSMICICDDTQEAIKNMFDCLIKEREKKRLPVKQRRVLTFIAEGVVKRGDI